MSREFYLVLHLSGVISWMAGLLYLIRLFVYHKIETEAVVMSRFEVMEMRLYRYICFPAMVVSFLAGIGLISKNYSYFLSQPWFHMKLGCVMIMMICTLLSGSFISKFKMKKRMPSEKFFRIYNELPTILMILILILIFYKPIFN